MSTYNFYFFDLSNLKIIITEEGDLPKNCAYLGCLRGLEKSIKTIYEDCKQEVYRKPINEKVMASIEMAYPDYLL